MRRLFLSTSFTNQINHKTGAVNSAFRKSTEDIIKALRNIDGLTVFCALEYEGWVISKAPPEVSIKKDIEEIKRADFVVGLVPKGTSLGGVQFEMGIAYALGKKVFAATEPGTELSFFNQGTSNLGYVTHIVYESPASLARQLKII